MNSRFFLTRDLERITLAVRAAEKHTSGEIVPVIARKSVPFAWLVAALGFTGLLAGTACGFWISHRWPFATELHTIFLLQGTGLLVGALLGCTPWVLRQVLGPQRLAHEVRAAAQQAFMQEGLMRTKERTGILIYVSLRERHVVILADQGINDKVKPGYWDGAVKKIVDGIRLGTSGDALAEVIGEMGSKLGDHFPRKPGDVNEIPDEPRLR